MRIMSDLNLFKFEDYHTRYCQYRGLGFNPKIAWEKTEQEYQELTRGVSKYSSYESFKTMLTKKSKK
jgi:hypothetical protein